MKEAIEISVKFTKPEGGECEVIIGEDELDISDDAGNICFHKDALTPLIAALQRVQTLQQCFAASQNFATAVDEHKSKPAKGKK